MALQSMVCVQSVSGFASCFDFKFWSCEEWGIYLTGDAVAHANYLCIDVRFSNLPIVLIFGFGAEVVVSRSSFK